MAFQVSPGVQVREIDLTNVVPAVSTSIGAIAGSFEWGPVNQIVQVGSENRLVSIFGEPNDANYKFFLGATQFLQYANDLRVVRTDIKDPSDPEVSLLSNANADGSGTLIRNEDDFETMAFDTGDEVVAKYPGELGNSIGVEIVTNETSFDALEDRFQDQFDFKPSTTQFAEDRSISGDELHVIVYDKDGKITGTEGELLETFAGLSQAENARKADGTNNFYRDVINEQSAYIWVGQVDTDNLPEAGTNTNDTDDLVAVSDGFEYSSVDTVIEYDLSGGSSGGNLAAFGDLVESYQLFADAETVDINFIIGPDLPEGDDENIATQLVQLVEDRRDVVAFLSPSSSRTRNNQFANDNVIEWADTINSTSYAVLDSTAIQVYDRYNDKFRWVNAAGSVAGLCAFTDNVQDPWFSPAGFNRGQIRGVIKIAHNPVKSERDSLYKARVNPIVSFPGEGTVLFGDKTALSRPSAFDRINVRRLFITLEKAISSAAKFQLFELNDEFTRAQFRNLVEPFLRDVQGRRGVTDFQVICDETNNTPEVIDSNRFVADIYIKPARSINFITLNFIAVRTGVDFSEIAG
jgi:phage tail sheath protein FI